MSNWIKDLASKLTKLELQNRLATRPIQNEGNRNQVPFRRPFQPQKHLQHPRRNLDDQNVQPPLNNIVEENQQEEWEDEYINLFGETSQSTCLTLQEYEDQSRINLFLDDQEAHIHV